MVANFQTMTDVGDFDEEEGMPFSQVLAFLTKPRNRRDPRSIRLAAVSSALLETVQEKLGNESAMTSAGLFTAALNALNGTLSQDSTTHEMASSPQVPLLEIIRIVTPYVSSSNPAIFKSQFSLLSRTIRSIITTATTISGGSTTETADELGGMNALIRQCIRTATSCLNGILVIGSFQEKDVLKCFHGCILDLFDEKKPKIRREAHTSAINLLALCSQLEKNKFLLEEQILKYSHFILQRKSKDKGVVEKTNDVQTLHLLSFWEAAANVLRDKSKAKIGEDCIQLILKVISRRANKIDSYTTTSNQGQSDILLLNAALSVILSALELGEENTMNDTGAQITEFASRALASLLQNNASFLSLTSNEGECRVVYVRCIITTLHCLLSSTDENKLKIGLKLVPLSISCILNQADAHSSQVAYGCLAELNRMIYTCLSYPLQHHGTEDCLACLSNSKEAIQKILHHRYHIYWDRALAVLASFITTIVQGIIASNEADEDTISKTKLLISPLIKGLIRLHGDANDATSKKAVEQAVDAVIQGIGIELFLSIVNLSKLDVGEEALKQKSKKQKNVSVEGAVLHERAWLLPIMKSSATKGSASYRPRLSFFQAHILGLARKCDIASAKQNATAAECAIQKSRVIELWALLPAFCYKPIDLDVTFPTLCQTLMKAIGDSRYPQLVTIISAGLKTVVDSISENMAESQTELNILSETSTKILPSLFKIVEKLNNEKQKGNNAPGKENMMETEDGQDKKERQKEESLRNQQIVMLTETIGAYASICPSTFLQTLFKKIMQRLLMATQSEDDAPDKICTLLGLAQALIKSGVLDDGSISILYRAVRPLIRTDESSTSVQKKSYKVLAEICEKHKDFILTSERLGEMTELMVNSVFTCQTASRHMRLKCMTIILDGFKSDNKQQMEVIPKIMGEVLLCLKDSNTKTREAAYLLLVSMAHICNDITEYFKIVLAALGAQTPHMRSAAVMGLSRLVFEFARNDTTVEMFLPSLLQTVCVLFDENSREVIKSVISFVRVCVAAISEEHLEPLLPEVVNGIMKYNKGKGRFRSKIKIIMKKLVRKFGYEKITPLVPENDSRLLTHMRKLSERAERRRAQGIEEVKESAREANAFDEMMDSDEDDSDDGRTLMTGATGLTRMSNKSYHTSTLSKPGSVRSVKSTKSVKDDTAIAPRINIKGETKGNIFDMLDSNMTNKVHYGNDEDDSFSSDDEGAMEFDDHGRLVVPNDDDSKDEAEEAEEDDDVQENDEIHGGGKRQRISKLESAKIERDEASKKRQKKRNEKQNLGAAYKSKKAGGDVKKKGQKYEPYAFVPLDGKRYSKKHRNNAVEQMESVVRNHNKKRKRR